MINIEDVDLEMEFETLKKCADGCGKVIINEDKITDIMVEALELLKVMGFIEYMIIYDGMALRHNVLVRIK